MRNPESSAALRKLARQRGVRPPSYSIPAAQAEVQTSTELREAAAEIVNKLAKRDPERQGGGHADERAGSGSDAKVPAAKDKKSGRRSRRGKAEPVVIHFKI